MITAIGKVGQEILKHLYTGKKWVGTQSTAAAAFAAKKGHPGISKAITGTAQRGNQAMSGISKKTHLGNKYLGKKIKKYPKTSAALGGAVAWDILDND